MSGLRDKRTQFTRAHAAKNSRKNGTNGHRSGSAAVDCEWQDVPVHDDCQSCSHAPEKAAKKKILVDGRGPGYFVTHPVSSFGIFPTKLKWDQSLSSSGIVLALLGTDLDSERDINN